MLAATPPPTGRSSSGGSGAGAGKTATTYPLYTRGSEPQKLQHGLQLFCRNVQQLLQAMGEPTPTPPKQILPALHLLAQLIQQRGPPPPNALWAPYRPSLAPSEPAAADAAATDASAADAAAAYAGGEHTATNAADTRNASDASNAIHRRAAGCPAGATRATDPRAGEQQRQPVDGRRADDRDARLKRARCVSCAILFYCQPRVGGWPVM